MLINWPFYGQACFKDKVIVSSCIEMFISLGFLFYFVSQRRGIWYSLTICKIFWSSVIFLTNAVQEMLNLSTSDTGWLFMSQNSCITDVCAYNNFVCGISCRICFKNVAVQVIWVSEQCLVVVVVPSSVTSIISTTFEHKVLPSLWY